MPRLVFTVSDKMDKALKRRSEETGAPVSALIREAITEWAQKRGISLENGIAWGGVRRSEFPQEPEQESGELVAARAV